MVRTDANHSKSPTFERTVNQARDTLGQIYTYTIAHAAAAAQLHTHVISILVFQHLPVTYFKTGQKHGQYKLTLLSC